MRCINKGKNLMFVGPAGTGKTQVVFKAAEQLDKKNILLQFRIYSRCSFVTYW